MNAEGGGCECLVNRLTWGKNGREVNCLGCYCGEQVEWEQHTVLEHRGIPWEACDRVV